MLSETAETACSKWQCKRQGVTDKDSSTGSIALGQSHWVGHKWGRLLCEDLVLAVTSQHHRRALQADRLGHHPLCRSLAFGC